MIAWTFMTTIDVPDFTATNSYFSSGVEGSYINANSSSGSHNRSYDEVGTTATGPSLYTTETYEYNYTYANGGVASEVGVSGVYEQTVQQGGTTIQRDSLSQTINEGGTGGPTITALSSTFSGQTTMTSVTSFVGPSTTMTSFSSTFLDSTSMAATSGTGSFSILTTISSSYSNVATTTASAEETLTVITTTSATNYFGAVVATWFLPQPGEVVWLATDTSFSFMPLSSLTSTTDQFSLYTSAGGSEVSPPSVTSYSITVSNRVSQTSQQFVLSSVTGIDTQSQTVPNGGGFYTATTTTYSEVASNTTFPVTSYSTTAGTVTGNFFNTTTLTALSFGNTTTTSLTWLGIQKPLGSAYYASTIVTVYGSFVFTVTSTSNCPAAYSTSGSFNNQTAPTSDTSFTAPTSSASGQSEEEYGYTGFIPTKPAFGFSVISATASAFVKQPNWGFRLGPTAPLVSQIGIGDTNNFSFGNGGLADFVFTAPFNSLDYLRGVGQGQTVPLQLPGLYTWTNVSYDNTDYTGYYSLLSYSASWQNYSTVSVTGATPLTTASGTSTLTYSVSTESSLLAWTGGGNVTDVLFNVLTPDSIDGIIRLGSGTYYTDFTGPATLLLSQGLYSSSNGTFSVTDNSTTFTLSTNDFIRSLALAGIDPSGNSPPYVVDVRSNYNLPPALSSYLAEDYD